MTQTTKLTALRLALRTAKADYGLQPQADLASIIAYWTGKVKVLTPPRAEYRQVPSFVVVGAPNGQYRCKNCGRRFGEHNISPTQWRAYLTLHCPHCFACNYIDA